MKKQMLRAVWSAAVVLLCGSAASGVEPLMSDYVSFPLFQAKSVMPNILIMLDNSGSMNFPAYPDPYNPDDNGLSNGTVLTGARFSGVSCTVVSPIVTSSDDAEERLKDNKIFYCGTDFLTNTDLDLTTDYDQPITVACMPPVQQIDFALRGGSGLAAAARGMQVASSFAGLSMSDAGSLPAAGRAMQARAFKEPGGRGLELEPYGMDSGQADGVVVDQWFLSREKAGKPYMVAIAHSHSCTHADTAIDCACMNHNCVNSGRGDNKGHNLESECTAYNQNCGSHTCDHGSSAAACKCTIHKCLEHDSSNSCTAANDHCGGTITSTTTSSSNTTSTTTTVNYCANDEAQVVGLRFQNISIPKTVKGFPVTITKAYIVFTAKGNNSQTTNLYIKGEYAGNAATFSSLAADGVTPTVANISSITNRPETTAQATWSVNTWTPGLKNADTTTPSLKAIVQEIIRHPDWAPGNAMVFKIRGDAGSVRQAYSFDGATGTNAGKQPYLYIEYTPCPQTLYYGYFDPNARYIYSTNAFRRTTSTASDTWDGNFLNWLTMRRIDVLRKALMGGKKPCETCSGKTNLIGETPPISQKSRYWQTYFRGAGFSPYVEAWYGVKDGKLYVKTTTQADPLHPVANDPWNSSTADFAIEVETTQANEPGNFCLAGPEAGNPCGIIQKVGDRARWGNIWFDSSNEGGRVSSGIGGGIRDIINDFQSTNMDTSTPLSETLYTAMKYFAQDSALPSGYSNSALPSPVSPGGAKDPFFDGKEVIPCAKSFVLLLTDGVPQNDKNIPANIQSYDNDTNATTRTYACSDDTKPETCGSDYLDDVALYSHVNDLRSDLLDTQTMDTYVIYAFGKNQTARTLLKETAMSGGFNDLNNNKKPDGYDNDGNFLKYPREARKEWDKDGNGIPYNFYGADNGYKLEAALIAAINSIMNRAASGTAVSVLATTGEGEGTLVQAIFRPSQTSGTTGVTWTGFLQALWVDAKGNIREDGGERSKGRLDVAEDKIVSYYFDQTSSETRVKRYGVSAADPYPDMATAQGDNVSLENLLCIWEGGNMLAGRPADDRKIFTYTGSDAGTGAAMVPDDCDMAATDSTGNCISFHTTNAGAIRPFLGIEDTITYGYLHAIDPLIRAENLIEYIRGKDAASLQPPVNVRTRTMDDGRVWKLGDIVYSTPVTISKPVEKYDIIYDDRSYSQYIAKYGDNTTTGRETMVYVGANDGMLHAFTSGWFNTQKTGFEQRNAKEAIGDELWAYIPRALLPHLKWLPRQDYDLSAHVSFVDLKPKVIDVRIFTDDGPQGIHPGGWGTVLIGGMNFGGKYIWTNNSAGVKNGDYYSSFFAIDITDPRNPVLLWDKWFPGMGLSINQPTVIQVGRTFDSTTRAWNSDDNWFLAIGSGYDDYAGNTTHKGSLYIVDIKTGELKRQVQTTDALAYMNTPIAIDKALDYSVDALYVAGNYLSGTTYASKVYRLGIPITSIPYIEGRKAQYDPLPANWLWTTMLAGGLPPISAPFTISSDTLDNVWLYLGTGRFQTLGDKTSKPQNYLVGIKDPFYNKQGRVDDGDAPVPDCYRKRPIDSGYNVACEDPLTLGNLLYANPYVVKPKGEISTTGTLPTGQIALTSWTGLLAEMKRQNTSSHRQMWQGWYRKMQVDSTTSERVVNKPTVFGGVALFPAYIPSSDTCSYGGSSSLYALYYGTGTAYKNPVLAGLNNTAEIQYRQDLGYGLSSSFGIHAAKEKGDTATVYSQMSTGVINAISITPAVDTRSGIEYWKEGR